jgi:hypothetical protein
MFGGEDGLGGPEIGGLGRPNVDVLGGNPQPRAPKAKTPSHRSASVARVSGDRNSGTGQVEADLSGTAGAGPERELARRAARRDHFEVGLCRTVRELLAKDPVAPGRGGGDGAEFQGRSAGNQRGG